MRTRSLASASIRVDPNVPRALLDLQQHIAAVKRIATLASRRAAATHRTPLRRPAELGLRAMLFGALHGVTSASVLCDAIDQSLMLQWFIDVDASDGSVSPRAMTLDCLQLIGEGTARAFFEHFAELARAEGLLAPCAATRALAA